MNYEKVKEIKYRLKKEYFKLDKEYFKLDKEYSDHLAYGGKADEREEKTYFLRDVIECINELESENERLKKDNETLRNAKVVYENVDYCVEDLKKAQDRIAELEKENKENNSYAKGYADGIKNTYEAMLPQKLKQFAERLKEKGKSTYDFFQCPTKENKVISFNDVDETLKEFEDGK